MHYASNKVGREGGCNDSFALYTGASFFWQDMQSFPDVMCGVDKGKLLCDDYEFEKHTRTSYITRGIRSIYISFYASPF